jgi:hypothetical protein
MNAEAEMIRYTDEAERWIIITLDLENLWNILNVEWSLNELKGFEVILIMSADAEMLRYTAEAESWRIISLNQGNLLKILNAEWSL